MQFDPESYHISSTNELSEEQRRIAELDGNFLMNFTEVSPFQLKSKGEINLKMAKIGSQKIKDFREFIKKTIS